MSHPIRIEPGPGQESVWDYPRPPRVEPSERRVRVEFAGATIADSTSALRVLETSSPPTIYVPPGDVVTQNLRPAEGTTYCEWKGTATYFDFVVGDRVARKAVWTYTEPKPGYESLTGYLSFYPRRVDACWLDDERVQAQPGPYYGGWVTADIVGPYKGDPGTAGW